MRVIAKFERTGNQMLYEVTVEDPVVLVQPWVMPSRTLRIANANTIIAEREAAPMKSAPRCDTKLMA
jgi:hypothetical protein